MVRLDLMAKKTQWPQEPPQYPKGMNCEQHTSDPRFACKMAACAIQACLAANDYQQRRCTREVQELVECCKYMSEANSVHCQGFGIIKQPPAIPQQPAQTEGPVDATANVSIRSVGSSSTPAHAQPAASSHAPAVHDSQAFGTKSSGRSVAGRTEAGSDSNSSSRMGVAAGSSRQSSGSVHGRES